MENYTLKSVQGPIKNWWVSLVVGILSIIFGVLFILYPYNAWVTLIILFVLGFFIAGLFDIFFSVSNRYYIRGWGWMLAGGILDISLGVLLLCIPSITPIVMVYVVGLWILFQSIWAIGISVDLRNWAVKGWGWLLCLAILGLITSFLFIISPIYTTGLIVIMAAASFIIYGIFRIYLSIELRSLKSKLEN